MSDMLVDIWMSLHGHISDAKFSSSCQPTEFTRFFFAWDLDLCHVNHSPLTKYCSNKVTADLEQSMQVHLGVIWRSITPSVYTITISIDSRPSNI